MISEVLSNFVQQSVAHFDESHDFNHAKTVTTSAHKIMHSLQPEYDTELLSYMAMLHDVRDHKYPNSITEDELKEFVRSQLGEDKLEQVMYVIENLSWSKEEKGLRKVPPSGLENYLIAVSDADRLEAIGKVGLKRCYEFSRAKHPDYTHEQIVNRVVVHCHEKLLRLYAEHFIVSECAQEIAEPLHDEILVFLENPTKYVF
jgi:uncharacterized protein